MLCTYFDWALNQPTVFDFCEILMTLGVIFPSDVLESHSGQKTKAGRKEAKNLNKLVRTLCRASTLFYQLLNFRASEVASAIVLLSRKLFGI